MPPLLLPFILPIIVPRIYLKPFTQILFATIRRSISYLEQSITDPPLGKREM